MDKLKDKGVTVAWFRFGAACLLVLLLLIVGILEAKKEMRCSALTQGTLKEIHQADYGCVERHNIWTKRECNNKIVYRIDCAGAVAELEFYYKGDGKPPDTIQVKYNPSNPHEFYYDASEVPGAPLLWRSEGKWVYHKFD